MCLCAFLDDARGGHIPFTWACIRACVCWNSGLQVCIYDFTLLYIYIWCYHNQIMASNKNIPSCTGQISLKNKLQYVYFDNFVKFVNCIHHKPPRTASIFLTRHLGLLTRHHGRCHATCHATSVFQLSILLKQCR